MKNVLKNIEEKHSKKINKIEKIKKSSTPKEALERLKNLKVTDSDRAFFLKCFGCFYKKESDDYMIRVRVKGSLTQDQAKAVGDVAKRFGDDYIDLTTRMQIELRYIKEDNLYEVLTVLQNAGITTYQTGVDNFRGLLYDPLCSISKGSLLNDRLLRDKIEEEIVGKDIASLPRKFNIGICGNIQNSSNVFTQDLGFGLAKRDGVIGYRVFLGGRSGMIGVDSNLFVDENEALILFKGVKEIFKKYGFRDNRNKNRFVFFLRELGLENFINLLESVTDHRFKRGGEILTSTKINHHLKERLLNEKFAYKFIVPAGIFSGSDMIEAAKLAKDYSGDVVLTFDQNFYITNCDEDIVNSALYKKFSPSSYKNNLIACAGTKTCSFGVIENKPDAINLANSLQKNIPTDGIIKFYWSACVKGCGIHGVGDFGFEGAKVKTMEGTKPGVHLFIGGSSNKEGKKVLTLPLEDIKRYITPMIKLFNNREDKNLTYEEWYKSISISHWASAFIMSINAKYFEFLPTLPLKYKGIEYLEIPQIGEKLFYQIAVVLPFDDIFSPISVKTLKSLGFKDKIHTVIDNMVAKRYKVWSEVLSGLD